MYEKKHQEHVIENEATNVESSQQRRGREDQRDPAASKPHERSKDIRHDFNSHLAQVEETMNGVDAQIEDIYQKVDGLEDDITIPLMIGDMMLQLEESSRDQMVKMQEDLMGSSRRCILPSAQDDDLEERSPTCWRIFSATTEFDSKAFQSNVRKEETRKPIPPCVVCRGSGRVNCRHCQGRGRTNLVNLIMLPKGEWPRWCKVCGGSGLDHCNRCLGTGEYRDIMGFHFMKMDTNSMQR
ncbi:uncharacterized protein LOC110019165 [Phalaenopsis equestris]|uniref:uncharacterized protein LOC110019165 n=1 Tax=Phalaenopsis equestris TaxID=78828 RepID=UPI0009E57BFC|nr:uncharacterized protein LOC110019165 [Phalaenopsis equestris]